MGCHDAEDGEKGKDGMPREGEEELAKGQTIALSSLYETVFGIALELAVIVAVQGSLSGLCNQFPLESFAFHVCNAVSCQYSSQVMRSHM